MAESAEVVAAYGAAWNEKDEGKRKALLEKAWSDGATYTDPSAHVEGRDALVAHIAGFHGGMPGAQLALTSAVDEHHGSVRFTWAIKGTDGAQMMEGVDFGVLGDDGRLASITGFFGPPAPPSG
ncbi:MAG: nuclear transport factor 2 family protein [Dehalococcoidia bacterium]